MNKGGVEKGLVALLMRHYEAQMQYVRSTKAIDKFKVLDNH